MRRRVIPWLIGLCVAAAVGLILYCGRSQAPLAFVCLRHEVPGKAPFHSWQQPVMLAGAAERVLAQALTRRGVRVVEQLEPKAHRRLKSETGALPTPQATHAASDAQIGLVGELQCVEIEAAEPATRRVRVALHLRAIDLVSGRVLVRLAAEAHAPLAKETDPCEQAAADAGQQVADRLSAELLSKLGLSADS